MKKKTISYVLASVACVVVVIIALVAIYVILRPNKKDEEVYVTSISMSYIGDKFELDNGVLKATYSAQILSVTKDDISVSVTYSDGITKQLTASEIQSSVGLYSSIDPYEKTNAGEYEISISHGGKHASMSIVVDKATIDTSDFGWLYNPVNKFQYDGTLKTVTLINVDYKAIKKVTYTNNKQTEAGKYTATASFEVYTNYYPVNDMILEWEIVA